METTNIFVNPEQPQQAMNTAGNVAQAVMPDSVAPAAPVTSDTAAYTLRGLQAGDVFLMVRILGCIGIQEFKGILDSIDLNKFRNEDGTFSMDEKKIAEIIGVDVVFTIAGIILENLPKCENNIYLFIANLSGMKPQNVKELPMDVFFNIIVDIVQKDEFSGFIKVVSKLFK